MRPDGGSGVREAASFRRSRRREKSPRFGQQARCALRLARARRHMRAIRRANRAGADTRPPAQDTRELGSRRTARPGAAPTPPSVMFAALGAAAGRTERSGTKRDEGTTCGRQTNTASTERTCRCNTVSSPACGRGRERAGGRATGQGPAWLREILGRIAAYPKRLRPMHHAHPNHDIS